MSDEGLQGNEGGVITVKRKSNAGTEFSDRFDGTIGAVNPLVAASAMIREKSSQRIRGAADPTGLPCSCGMFTSRRGAPESTCTVCGGDRA
jgi:hypothetical protein